MSAASGRKRPAPTTMGAVLMCLRALAGVLVIAVAFGDREDFLNDVIFEGAKATAEERAAASAFVDVLMIGYGAWLLFYLVLAWLVLRGVNWARVAAMLFATVSILVSFFEWWQSGLEITLRTTLLSLALDILILLALSSRAARAFARRNDPAPALAP
ncbi:hypothetical protein [Microterricola viridarii]|uniref:Uncharacterized protein n=1 Tax=Microterricola viridarii TaxID=412690 RepID=A0A1H1LM53_9MICO|nr:hypothetical protein [Microterricola viridarii]SDR75644.1 hypothetical protein SAMN04489834_0152 [Microterricola viridarii]